MTADVRSERWEGAGSQRILDAGSENVSGIANSMSNVLKVCNIKHALGNANVTL